MKKLAVLGLILLVGCAVIATVFMRSKQPNVQSKTGTVPQKASSKVTELAGTQTTAGKATTSQAVVTQSPCQALMAPGGRDSGRRVMDIAVKRLLRYIRRELDTNRMHWWLKCRQITPKDFLNMLIGRLYQAVNAPVKPESGGMVTKPLSPGAAAAIAPTQSSKQQVSAIPLKESSDQPNAGKPKANKVTETQFVKFFQPP